MAGGRVAGDVVARSTRSRPAAFRPSARSNSLMKSTTWNRMAARVNGGAAAAGEQQRQDRRAACAAHRSAFCVGAVPRLDSRFYHPGPGFTALIGFPGGPRLRGAGACAGFRTTTTPAWAVYDGQFYAQRALRSARARSAGRPRDGSGAVSRAAHSLQLDGVPGGPRPAGVDPRGVRAAERRRLADPGRPAGAMDAAGLAAPQPARLAAGRRVCSRTACSGRCASRCWTDQASC